MHKSQLKLSIALFASTVLFATIFCNAEETISKKPAPDSQIEDSTELRESLNHWATEALSDISTTNAASAIIDNMTITPDKSTDDKIVVSANENLKAGNSEKHQS